MKKILAGLLSTLLLSSAATGQISGIGPVTGTGNTVVLQTSPTLITPALGTPSSGVGTNITGVNAATLGGATFAIPGAIGGTTPAAAAFTTLSTSGLNTPTAGIKGRSTVANADAGNVGEYIASVVGATSLPTTSQWGDLTSISLTAGDWDVSVVAAAYINTATLWSDVRIGISTTTGNSSTGLVFGDNEVLSQFTAAITPIYISLVVPNWRVNIASTVTYYFKALSVYSGGQAQMYGRISARRVQPGP